MTGAALRRAASAPAPAQAAGIVALALACMLALPDAAYANPITDMVDSGISGLLRDGCNAMLSLSNEIASMAADIGFLTDGFDELFPTVYPILRSIWRTVTIPVSNIVLAVCLVAGLVKVVSNMGRSDGGVDMWQLVMVFVGFTFMLTAVNSSWTLMVMMFDMARDMIHVVMSAGIDAGALSAAEIPDDVVGSGYLLVALLVCMLVAAVSILTYMITYGVMIVRCIQVYLMTAFGAIPLCFIISESSRQIATGFAKRYMALLFSGVIIMMLILMYSAIVGLFTFTAGPITDAESGNEFLMGLVGTLTASAAYAYCMAKSGSWARDFFGI